MDEHQKMQLNVIDKIVSKDTIFVDIGACRGDILFFLSKKCKYGYAFEPNKENFKYLENKCSNVKLSNLAILNFNGMSPFFGKDDYTGNIMGHDMSFKPMKKLYDIECVTMDKLFADIDIDFVKIDAEGAEWKILDGAKNLLKRKKIIFQVEFHLDEDWDKKIMLEEFGYNILDMNFQKIKNNASRIYQGILAHENFKFN